jgi:hypothetical protein
MARDMFRNVLLALALTGFASNAFAEWVLNNGESAIDFISIKKSKVGELHTFGTMAGSLKSSGEATVVISLESVQTMIPIRDERMKSMLFEVVTFPEAIVSTTVDHDRITSLKVGESILQSLQLSLSLHGEVKSIDADMRIVMLAGNKLLVSTSKPLIVNADDFTLGKGVEMLREVAKLPSISTAVPVTVNLVFDKQEQLAHP